MADAPDWNTPARLDGLPCTNWKKRTGVTMDGTLAECVARWLSLQGYQQPDCSLGWGPDRDGQYGKMSAPGIARYVLNMGLPPKVAANRGGQPQRPVLERMVAMEPYRASPSWRPTAGDGKSPGIKLEDKA